MILGFAGFSIVLAIIHNSIRKYIYKDAHSLDTVFDAGGKVTLSLTAVTVTSQLLWPADFLQITTITINSYTGIFFFSEWHRRVSLLCPRNRSRYSPVSNIVCWTENQGSWCQDISSGKTDDDSTIVSIFWLRCTCILISF